MKSPRLQQVNFRTKLLLITMLLLHFGKTTAQSGGGAAYGFAYMVGEENAKSLQFKAFFRSGTAFQLGLGMSCDMFPDRTNIPLYVAMRIVPEGDKVKAALRLNTGYAFGWADAAGGWGYGGWMMEPAASLLIPTGSGRFFDISAGFKFQRTTVVSMYEWGNTTRLQGSTMTVRTLSLFLGLSI